MGIRVVFREKADGTDSQKRKELRDQLDRLRYDMQYASSARVKETIRQKIGIVERQLAKLCAV